MSNFLRNADDGIRRADWKYAIDSLQRIIDHPGDSLVTQNGQVYYSGRLHAQRLLSNLPAEPLRIYRLLHDGQAKALYAQGRDSWQAEPLEEVVRRFLLTDVGDNAADLLASLYIDAGRGAEAAGVLRTLLELHPDSDVPEPILKGKLAVAMAMSGARDAAKEILGQLQGLPRGAHHGAVRAFVRSQDTAEDVGRPTKRWAMRGGDAGRQGRMDEVEPTFVEAEPLQFELPSDTEAVTWDQALEFMDRYPSLPVYGVVTDGRQLLVRCQDRVVSLDVDSMEPIWQSDPPVSHNLPPENINVVVGRQRTIGPSPIDEAGFLSALVDQTSGGLCYLKDRAYFLSRDGPAIAGRPGVVNQQVIVVQGGQVRVAPRLNRLVSIQAGLGNDGIRPGTELWSRGGLPRPGEKDPLRGVEFLSLPIDVGGALLVAYRDSDTFNAAVLSPEDGELKRTITLCDLNDAGAYPMQALHPVLAGRVVYVPSNLGVVFALDAVDWSIRWASRYPRALPRATTADRTALVMHHLAGDQWLDSPALVVGDSIVVAPSDSSDLLAFDRHTGQIQWNLPRENHRYVLGRRGEHVLVGGGSVSSVESSSGTVSWSRQVGSATGRAVISGRLVYVPTRLGLISLDADSGQVTGRFDLPPDGAPFGNLLCWDGAMYSIDTSTVRKYHDVQRSYARALAAYESDSANLLNVLRLGRLELLRENPRRAIEILNGIAGSLEESDARRIDQLARLHVKARLGLAADEATPPEEAIGLVREALKRARSPGDRTRSRLELIERLSAAGQSAEAVEVCYPLLESPDGDDLVEMSDGWWCRANLMAPGKIETLLAGVERADRTTLEAALRGRLQDAIERRAKLDVRRLAEGAGQTQLAHHAWAQLGTWALETKQFAAAEACFRESLRARAEGVAAAQTLVSQMAIYSAADLDLSSEKAGVLSRLLRDHAEASVLLRPNDAPVPVDTFVKEHWPDGIAMDRDVDFPDRPAVQGSFDPVWRLTEPQALNWIVGGPRVGADRFLTFRSLQRIDCRSIEIGRPVWETALLVPDVERRIVGFQSDGVGPRPMAPSSAPEIQAARDGHILVLLTEDALFGLDLITGKRLWARRLDTRVRDDVNNPGTLNVDESRYALLRGSNTVEVGSLLDGRLLWRRQMIGRHLGALRLSGDHVLTVDRDFETLYAFRRHDGAFASQCRFRQGARPDQRMSLAVFENICCGPEEKDIIAYDITTGKVVWRHSIQHDNRVVFRPRHDVLGVGTRFGHAHLINPKTGELEFSHRVKEASGGILDGVWEGDRLLVLGLHTVGGIEENCLASISVIDQSVTWVRSDLGSGRIGRGRPSFLRMARNVVPMLTHAAAQRQAPGESRRLGTLTLIDKSTGENVGTYPLETRADNDILSDELLLWEDRILVGTRRGVLALGREVRQGDLQ